MYFANTLDSCVRTWVKRPGRRCTSRAWLSALIHNFGFGNSESNWSSGAQATADLGHHLPNYIGLFIVFAILFGVAVAALGQRIAQFVPSFLVMFVVSTLIFEGRRTGPGLSSCADPADSR